MKLLYPKNWFKKSAEIEGDSDVGAGCSAEVDRLKRGLEDVHSRASGKRGNPKWIIGHLENLIAGREYDDWG